MTPEKFAYWMKGRGKKQPTAKEWADVCKELDRLEAQPAPIYPAPVHIYPVPSYQHPQIPAIPVWNPPFPTITC